jgi:hypothetical protein
VSRRFVLPVVVVAVAVFGAGLTGGCSRDGEAAKRSKQSVFVIERIVPIGKLVAAASADGSIQKREIPGDVVPEDAVTTLDDVRCLVAARDLPIGSVVRRSMLVEPSKLGLEHGLTGDSSPTSCS